MDTNVRPAWLGPWLHKVKTQPKPPSKRLAERAEIKAANAKRKAEYHAYIAKIKAERTRLIELRKAERNAGKALRGAECDRRKIEREGLKQQRQERRKMRRQTLSVVKPVQLPRLPKTRPIPEEGFTPDPAMWPDDGGAKRVPIYDHNFGQRRLVRRVGWTNCLGREPKHRIFSYDVAKERTCTSCKGMQVRGTIDDYG